MCACVQFEWHVWHRPQVSDLKLSIRGAATVKPDVSEEADGSLLVTYVGFRLETPVVWNYV
jgi:hypothetical protein